MNTNTKELLFNELDAFSEALHHEFVQKVLSDRDGSAQNAQISFDEDWIIVHKINLHLIKL